MEESHGHVPAAAAHHAKVRPDHPATREKDLGHLADLDLAPGRRRGARARLRPGRAGLRARHAPRDHRRQPAAPVLVDARRAGAGRRAGADVPGRAGRRLRLRAERRRDRVRDRRGPGAGRQAARGAAAACRRSRTSTTTIRAACATTRASRASTRLQEIGREFDRAHPGLVRRARSRAGQPDDVSVMLYTSGTTGKPKGVCQTHARVHRRGAAAACEFDRLTADDSILSYLPMAWVGDHLFSYRAVAGRGLHHQLPRVGRHGDDRPARDRPDLLLRAAARLREPADAGDDPDGGRERRSSAALFHHFMAVARRCGAEILDGKPVPLGDRLQYALGNLLVYGPLRNVLGMSRIRVAYTAGAAIGPDLFRFYRSIGVNLKQLYGSTETCAYVCLQPDGDVKLDTVGLPAPRRRSEDRRPTAKCWCAGRCCSRNTTSGPTRPRSRSTPTATSTPATPASSTPAGSSRSSTARRTSASSANGAMFAPNYIENKLKFFPHIKEAVAFGDGRDTRVRVHQHRHGIGRQLGRAARPRLFRLHRPRAEARGLRADPRVRGEGQRGARRRGRPRRIRRSTAS